MDEMFPHVVDCPHCGGPVSLDGIDDPQNAACPHCGATLAEEMKPEEPAADLDGARIRRIATLRRSTYRTRSYYLIGSGVCIVAAAQLVWLAVRSSLRHGWGLWESAYLLISIACLWAGIRLWKRAPRPPGCDGP